MRRSPGGRRIKVSATPDYTMIESTEWLFVRARTNRILAIRTAIDHVIVILPHAIITRALCEKRLTCQ